MQFAKRVLRTLVILKETQVSERAEQLIACRLASRAGPPWEAYCCHAGPALNGWNLRNFKWSFVRSGVEVNCGRFAN